MISNMSFKPSDYLRIYSGYVDSHSHQMIPKEWFEEYEDILFEGHFFKAIKQKEKFLTLLFGDYLTPPPAEDRKPHHSRYYVNLKQRKSLLMIRKLGY
jgi:phosphorylcholine metabolism protein LicD